MGGGCGGGGHSFGWLLSVGGRPGRASSADSGGGVVLSHTLLPLQAWWGITGAAVAAVVSSAVATLLKACFLAQSRDFGAMALLAPSPGLLWRTFAGPSPGRGGSDG
jgi:hypothetical protein